MVCSDGHFCHLDRVFAPMAAYPRAYGEASTIPRKSFPANGSVATALPRRCGSRLAPLAVQMDNGVYTSKDRDNAQLEVNALLQEIDKIASNTRFNDVKLLDGAYDQTIRAGNTNAETIRVSIDSLSTASTAKLANYAVEKAATTSHIASFERCGLCAKPLLVVASSSSRHLRICLLYTSPSPRDKRQSRMPSSA